MKATLTLLLVLALTILVTLLGYITPELIERASDAYIVGSLHESDAQS